MADRFPTPTVFLTEKEDTAMWEASKSLKIGRTEFIYQAILEKIEKHKNDDRNDKNHSGNGGEAARSSDASGPKS